MSGLQTDLFNDPPLAERPSALARSPLERYVSLTEALRRVGERLGLSRPTLYKMGVAAALAADVQAMGWARKQGGGLRRCAYRVPLERVERVCRRLEAGEVIIPPEEGRRAAT